MKKIINFMAILGTIIAICAIIYSIFKLYTINKEYSQVDDTYESIQDIYTEEINIEKGTTQIQKEIESDLETKNSNFIINWQALQRINKDTIAWIKIDDTNINYPIVQGEDNEKYIKKDINGKNSKGGCIFVDCEIKQPFNCFNTIIYGHNLNNGSMFNDLKNYSNKEYAQKHNEIYIYEPNEKAKIYKVFAFTKVNWDNYEIYNNNVDDLEAYYNIIQKYNKIDMGESIKYTNPIITLSTCTNNQKDERYVVFAYLDDGENNI